MPNTPPSSEAWAILLETRNGGVEIYRGGMTHLTAQATADEFISVRPEVRQVTVYPVEGGHAEGMASWVRDQDSAWRSSMPSAQDQ